MELPLSTPAKCKVRAVIRFLNAKGKTPIEIHHQFTEVYDESCMDIKSIRKWCWSLHLTALKFVMKNKAGDRHLAKTRSRHKIGGSLWVISAFRFLRFLKPSFIRFWWTNCNIGRCAQDVSHECWQKTTNGNESTLPVNFSAAMLTKRITFRIWLSRVTKPGHTTSHLRWNDNHVSGRIPLCLSRENSSKHSLPVKSWQLCFGIKREYYWLISWLLAPQ